MGVSWWLPSVPCHAAFPAMEVCFIIANKKLGGEVEGQAGVGEKERKRDCNKVEVAALCNHRSDVPTCLPYAVRSKVPVPPTLKRRWLYKSATIRKWRPLGATFVSVTTHLTCWLSFRCFILLKFSFFLLLLNFSPQNPVYQNKSKWYIWPQIFQQNFGNFVL